MPLEYQIFDGFLATGIVFFIFGGGFILIGFKGLQNKIGGNDEHCGNNYFPYKKLLLEFFDFQLFALLNLKGIESGNGIDRVFHGEYYRIERDFLAIIYNCWQQR